MPAMRPVTDATFDAAPQVLARTFAVPAPAEVVWRELAGPRPLHWCRGLDITWTSPDPHGVGSTRRAKVLGLLVAEERFYRWEDGRRHSFHFTGANLPLFESIAEDYLVEPDGAGRCHFTWRVALTPSTLGRPGAPVNRRLFQSFFADTARYFRAT